MLLFKNPFIPNMPITEKTINMDGKTKEQPHNETIILVIFKFLCLYKLKANGMARVQLKIADKKA